MTIICILAIYGTAWIWKESELFASSRNWIMQRSPFMIQLLSCWYCVGFWAGVFVYLLHGASSNAFEDFNPFEWIVWGLAGSATAAIGNAVFEKLSLTEVVQDQVKKETT